VIAAGNARNPLLLTTLGAGPQVIGVHFIEARFGQIELLAGLGSIESAGAELGKDMSDQRRSAAMEQLDFFIAARIQRLRRKERWIYRFFADSGRSLAKPDRRLAAAAQPAVYQPSGGAQVASPQSPILR